MKMEKSPFLDQVRNAIRVRHYSIRTEQAYLDWTLRFIVFHGKRHPQDMGETEVRAFLTHLAVNRKVAPSTQNQALNALAFLYKVVLERPLGDIVGAVRAKKPQKLPVVLTEAEVKQVLSALYGYHWMACCLLYGSGRTTQIYTHRINRGGAAVISPLNDLFAGGGECRDYSQQSGYTGS